MEPKYIAFYGTLMRRAEYHLEDLGVASMFDYAGECRIPGLLYHLGEYPGLVEGEGAVPGELYEIRDPRGLDILDRHEGVDSENPESSLYTRPAIQLVSPDLIAWVYLYRGNVEGLPRLARWPQI